MSDKIQEENAKRQEEQEQYTAKGAAQDIVDIGKDGKKAVDNVKGLAKDIKNKKNGETGSTNSPSTPGTSRAPSTPGASSAPTTPGASSAPSTPGASSAPTTPGASSAPTTPGASSASTTPGASSVPSTPGASSAPTTPSTPVTQTANAATNTAANTASTAASTAGTTASTAASTASTAASTASTAASTAGTAASTAASTAGTAAGVASGAVPVVGWVITGITVARKVIKKVENSLREKGHDVDGTKKTIRTMGILTWLGLHIIPVLIISFIFYLLVHQDSKTYDTVALLESYIECAEGATDCEDFMGVEGETVEAKNKRLIQFENGDWNPFVDDEVTEMTNKYVKFIMKNAKDDEAINFGFLNVGDVDSKVKSELLAGTNIKTESEKKVFNFKRKTIKTYLMLSATAFNNIEWYVAGPKNNSEVDPAYVPQWTSEENIREIKASVFNPLFIYDLQDAKFHGISTTMDNNNVTTKPFIDADGNPFTAEVKTGLNIPEVEHYGITEEQYLSILEPILPAWIEPFSIYTATGDWQLSQRVYDFYQNELDNNPYQVCLYTVPTIEKERIYNPRTFETDEIVGYEQKYNEETGVYEDDLTKPIYATATYYGKKPVGVTPVAGEIYSIDNPDQIIEHTTCTYTAVLKKGYAYEFYVDTNWVIEPAEASIGEPIISGGRAVANDIYSFYLKPTDEIEKKYTYTNKNGNEVEVRNRLEWYIMTHYTDSLLKRKELEDLGDEDLLDAFEKEGICEDNTKISSGDNPCGDKKHIEPFDYDIDALAYAIQRCDEYYERVKQEVSYSVEGVSSSAGAYLGYSGLAGGTFGWPVPGSTRISNCFGQYESGGAHSGIDISNMGKGPGVLEVVASADGIVEKVVTGCTRNDSACKDTFNETGRQCGGRFGNYVRVNHGNGYVAFYAHLTSVAVSEGARVTAGQKLGIMGSTGNSCGAHLHFELRKDGVKIDPTKGLMYGIPAGAAQGKRCQDTVVYQDMPTPSGGTAVSTETGSQAGTSKVQYIQSTYGDIIKKYSAIYGLDPNLVVAMIMQESSGNVTAENSSAVGLMQWEYSRNGTSLTVKKADGTKETITGITLSNLRNNPDFQIHVGCAELKKKTDEFYGNTMVALQGYNFGSGGIRRCISYHIAGHKNSGQRWCGVSESAYINYVKSGDTAWMHDTQWYYSTGCTEFGAWAKYHGDPNYLSNVLRFYDPNGL